MAYPHRFRRVVTYALFNGLGQPRFLPIHLPASEALFLHLRIDSKTQNVPLVFITEGVITEMEGVKKLWLELVKQMSEGKRNSYPFLPWRLTPNTPIMGSLIAQNKPIKPAGYFIARSFLFRASASPRDAGYFGFMSRIVLNRIFATAQLRYHLRLAGITYHGAHAVLQRPIASS